jgi:hypothetical protein
MYNPVILSMVAREQNRRLQEEYRNAQAYVGTERKSVNISRLLLSWFSREPPGQIENKMSESKESKIRQTQRGCIEC